jgi:uncharacterized membrane protein YdbT with pleckstrin-like domain
MDLLEGESLIWKGNPTWRATLSFYIRWGLLSLVPVVVVALVNGLTDTDWPIWVGVVITVAGLVLTIVVGWLRRIFTEYTITDQRINIRRGVLSKTENTARVDRVQNITINQTVIDRMLRVGTMDFDTASDDPTDSFQFSGVDDPQALRERIYQAHGNRASPPAPQQGGLS